MNMLTAKDIRELREKLKFSRMDLAIALTNAGCKISAYAVALWEQDKRHPRYATLVELNKLMQQAKRHRRVATNGASR
jgi:DNA-binding transcriptional regulator YiaG